MKLLSCPNILILYVCDCRWMIQVFLSINYLKNVVFDVLTEDKIVNTVYFHSPRAECLYVFYSFSRPSFLLSSMKLTVWPIIKAIYPLVILDCLIPQGFTEQFFSTVPVLPFRHVYVFHMTLRHIYS